MWQWSNVDLLSLFYNDISFKLILLTKWPVFPELASLIMSIFFSKIMHFWPKRVISLATAHPTAPEPMMRTSNTSAIFYTLIEDPLICDLIYNIALYSGLLVLRMYVGMYLELIKVYCVHKGNANLIYVCWLFTDCRLSLLYFFTDSLHQN